MGNENEDQKQQVQSALAAGTPETQKPPACPPKKRWTILLDIAADGTLANFGIESLKQLKNSATIAPYCTDVAEVTVAAQFSVDAPAGQKVPRYVFGPKAKGRSLSDFIVDYLNASESMTEQQALIDFLGWALRNEDLKADHYALILWGHGPLLLMQPPPAPGNDSISLYLTPIELRGALQTATQLLGDGSKFDLVAFDACSMSMFEAAYEIQDYARYMVASQEEVPDLSFPYDTLVPLFRQKGNNPETLLREGVYKYIETYQDYIDDAVTDMMPATLSALRLSNCNDLKQALRLLCCALYQARKEQGLPPLLIKARERARDFVSGLYVDLYDFAAGMVSAFNVGAPRHQRTYSKKAPDPTDPDYWKYEISQACKDVLLALEEDVDGTRPNLLLLAHCAVDGTSNGVSLYMPYLSNDQWIGMSRPMVKGGDGTRGGKGGDGTRGGKDFSAVLNDAGPQQLLCERRDLIGDTEHYYDDLQLSQDTGWYRFIVEQWTPILVNIAAKNLDVLYSAEQAALNACRMKAVTVKPECPDASSAPNKEVN